MQPHLGLPEAAECGCGSDLRGLPRRGTRLPALEWAALEDIRAGNRFDLFSVEIAAGSCLPQSESMLGMGSQSALQEKLKSCPQHHVTSTSGFKAERRMLETNAVPEGCLMPSLRTDEERQIRAFARSQSQSPVPGEKPRSLLGQGAAPESPRSPLHGLAAEQRGLLVPLSDSVSAIGCLFQGETGFRRFGGLITISLIPPWVRPSQVGGKQLGPPSCGVSLKRPSSANAFWFEM